MTTQAAGARFSRPTCCALLPPAAALAPRRAAMRWPGRGSFLPDYIKTLGIPMFGNATPYQSVEQVFTQKVRLEFQSSRRYTVVPSDEGVDGVVRGEISSISLQPVSLNDAAAGVAIPRHRDPQGEVRGRQGAARRCGRTRRCRSPTNTSSPQHQHGTGRGGVRRQRARRDGSHVHRLRALGRQRDPRGVLTGHRPSGQPGRHHVNRCGHSQADQGRQDRARCTCSKATICSRATIWPSSSPTSLTRACRPSTSRASTPTKRPMPPAAIS